MGFLSREKLIFFFFILPGAQLSEIVEGFKLVKDIYNIKF